MLLNTTLMIAAGGALGSVARHGMNQLIARLAGTDFPWGTMSVNIIGSLAIGLITGLLAFATDWSQDIRSFAVVGFLGGFTTFSAFSLDAALLWERGSVMPMLLYTGGSVFLSIAATFGGLYLIRTFTS